MKQYCYSFDEERYEGSFDSPEEAAWAGLHERLLQYPDEAKPSVWVGENCPPCMACPVDGDELIDDLQGTEDFDSEWAEGFDPSKAEREDLTRRVKAAWDEWLEANKIDPGFFTVQNSREWSVEFHKPFGGIEDDLTQCGVLKMVSKSAN